MNNEDAVRQHVQACATASVRPQSNLHWYTPAPRDPVRCLATKAVEFDSLPGMSGSILTPQDRAHFLRKIRRLTPSPVHRRMNALLLLDDGRAAERVPAVMFIDAGTVRELRRLYQVAGVAGIEQLKFEGSDPALSAAGSGTERRAVRVSKGNMRPYVASATSEILYR